MAEKDAERSGRTGCLITTSVILLAGSLFTQWLFCEWIRAFGSNTSNPTDGALSAGIIGVPTLLLLCGAWAFQGMPRAARVALYLVGLHLVFYALLIPDLTSRSWVATTSPEQRQTIGSGLGLLGALVLSGAAWLSWRSRSVP